ncbi:MAG TPA: AmmeMemoRadiSam system protein A [Tepidisphaeraceae bacterium]|nr:AmmeMemoRadiSam system protein A [Tepidisphaeraceae bacterium]
MDLTPASRSELLGIARSGLRAAVEGRELILPAPTHPELLQPAGCFVSLHERQSHRLRGCVGRLEASSPLWEIVRETAANVLDDPRFVQQRVTVDDLPLLDIELSVLSPLQPAGSCEEFDLLNEGIYLTCGERTGCFLPQVARETGWTREQLLERLCTEKLGLPGSAWRSGDVTLMRFTTLVIGPEPV